MKFKTFATFEDLIKTATKYDVAIQEIEDEKRQIEIVSHIAIYSRSEQKTDPEVTDAIKSLQEQTKELVNELKETKRFFNPRAKEADNRNPRERADGQRRPPQTFNYAPQAVYQPPVSNYVNPSQPPASYPQQFVPQNQYAPPAPQNQYSPYILSEFRALTLQ